MALLKRNKERRQNSAYSCSYVSSKKSGLSKIFAMYNLNLPSGIHASLSKKSPGVMKTQSSHINNTTNFMYLKS
jgi:hypothetical protein